MPSVSETRLWPQMPRKCGHFAQKPSPVWDYGYAWLWKQSAANRSLGSIFPANREMNSEFRRNSTPKAFHVAAKHLRLLPYRLNTHCNELGIHIELTANI